MNLRREIYRIGWYVFFIVVVGFGGNVYFTVNKVEGIGLSRVFLSLMMVAVGLVTFFGFIGMGVGVKDKSLSKTEIRLAIVVSVITLYLVLVGTVSFFSSGGELPVITNTMISHFTTIVGVVIAFYFGAAAYEAAQKNKGKADNNDSEGEESEEGKNDK